MHLKKKNKTKIIPLIFRNAINLSHDFILLIGTKIF
jgi:hypothetical protein